MELVKDKEYNWKVFKRIKRKAYKLVDYHKDNSSSSSNNEDEDVKIKVLTKISNQKRVKLDLWYDNLLIPSIVLSDTISYNCKLNDVLSTEDLFKIKTIDQLEKLFVLELDLDPSNLESCKEPKISKIYKIIERNGNYDKIVDKNNSSCIMELDTSIYTLPKLGVFVIIPNYKFKNF